MSLNRWHINRAGVVNFWLYDEAEFQLADGRLILRGPNGSGKSVTMQSFLPLVLDGDKRPNRLDPFGSRDRKIEYYMLGDGNSGHSDRTGYLYLEFVDKSVNKYLTVGIGLRAKRGAQSVSFWGFAITDQRRIGHDFFLYHQDDWELGQAKVPLDRATLEAAIGDGGKVVREQREYQNLVNQQLFGFEDIESYKELLNLLIQLRSPKLSKDHKPSVIYEILNEALPPLGDDELRPLSSVLEDLDEINDRLEELGQHKTDLQLLVSAYDQYNRMRLYDLSSQLLERHSDVTSQEKNTAQLGEKHQEFETKVLALTEELEEVRQDILQTESKIDTINRSDVMEKQHEYESVRQGLEDTKGQQFAITKRHDGAVSERNDKERRLAVAQAEWERYQEELQNFQSRLATLALESEFLQHDTYFALGTDLNFAKNVKDQVWSGVRRDIQEHRAQLREARGLGEQELRERDRVETLEKSLSHARQHRDEQERVVSERQKAFEQSLTLQADEILMWQRGLARLPVQDEQWRESLRRLQRFPEVSWSDVLTPIRDAFDVANADILRRRVDANHEKGRLEKAKGEHLQELAQWQNQREPEPPRTEAKSKFRQRRLPENGQEERQGAGYGQGTSHAKGAPLYALCEFHPKVDEKTRAALETALHQAGVLDAWVSPTCWPIGHSKPGDRVIFQGDEEEVFIQPNPLLFGETLAEYLMPAPSEESGLTPQQVDDVLRTIVLSDFTDGNYQSESSQMFIATDGRYRIGPLSGVSMVKPQAEWIGVEARRRTRLANIERLKAEIGVLDEGIGNCMGLLQALDEEQQEVRAEFQNFPSEEPLRAASQLLESAKLSLNAALEAEQRANEASREAARRLRDCQQQFVEFTSKWRHLRKLDVIEEAIDKLQSYEVTVSSLQSSVTNVLRSAISIDTLKVDLERLEDRIQVEEIELSQVTLRLSKLQADLQSLEQLLQASGFRELVAELDALRQRLQARKNSEIQLNKELSDTREARGGSEMALRQAQNQLEEAKVRIRSVTKRLESEWQLGLVAATQVEAVKELGVAHEGNVHSLVVGEEVHVQEKRNASSAQWVKVARDFVREERAVLESRQIQVVEKRLQEVFSITQSSLRDYALDQTYDVKLERWMVLSYRDRTHPQTPLGLLQQLELLVEEQRSLISEKDQELYEQILLHSVGNAIRDKINRAEQWAKEMDRFMGTRKTSSGFALSLDWVPRPASSEDELDTDRLVTLLRRSPETLRQSEIDQMMGHFRTRINRAKELSDDGATLRESITALLDYRTWFRFKLSFKKGDAPYRELTDSRFNVLSGGEKAMAMYIPLFAATDSRYKDSRPNAPRILSLDEAFAGVDEKNMSDMFDLLTEMGFDYMMTSQVLWGCYETVPSLSIYEVHRPNDVDFVTLFPYYWNGTSRTLVIDDNWESAREVAATSSEVQRP